jgi:hypothetical protein
VRAVSGISDSDDLALEERRERLRDWRWERRRSKLRFALFFVSVSLCIVGGDLLDVVREIGPW